MPKVLVETIKPQYFDDLGTPLAGGKLYSYIAGTSTLATTWSDSGGVTPNSNPVILDAAGRPTSGAIYVTAGVGYKFILQNASSVQIWSQDNVIIDGSDSGGTITGPGSSVDNTIARWDGTSGTTLQGSSASIDDSGNLTANNFSGTHTGASSGTNTGDQNLFSTIAVSGQSNVVAETPADTLTLVAGANVTITTDAATDSVTIAASGGGSASDSFKTIAVSGQSDVVADSSTDTLTLAAGSNVTITTNAATDTITIAASGSSSVGDLLDYQVVRKAADESVTSSIVLQSDDELLVALGANQTWFVDFTLFIQGATAGDIRVALNAPASATGTFGINGLAIAATATTGDVGTFAVADLTDSGAVQSGCAGAGQSVLLLIKAVVVTAGSAGNVTLRWAQGTSSGTATIVKADSYVEARRVA